MSATKPSLDSLFGGCEPQNTPKGIELLKLSNLCSYSKHPFVVKESDRLNELIESVREQGILTPLLVREHPTIKGKFEILAGHHRLFAAEHIGLDSVPCITKSVDDSNAALIVIDSNKQRGFADMLPSEIAKSLKLEYDALKCQGKRTDLVQELESILSEQSMLEKSVVNADKIRGCETSGTVFLKSELKDNFQMTERNMRYYIRLTYLTPDLLEMVDSNKIAIRPAIDLSFLIRQEQETVFRFLGGYTYTMDGKKAAALKKLSQDKKFSVRVAEDIIAGRYLKKPIKKTSSIKLNYKNLSSLVDTSLAPKEVESYIIKALEFYNQHNTQ